MTQCLFQKANDVVVVERVHATLPNSFHPHQLMLSKQAELVRHSRLLHPDCIDELRNTVGPGEEATQNLYSARS